MTLRERWHRGASNWQVAVCRFCQGCARGREAIGRPVSRPAGSLTASTKITAGPPLAFKWVPVVNRWQCTGCGLCAEACDSTCLQMVDGLAVLTAPDLCGSDEHCIPVCRDDAIRMQWVPVARDVGRGRWRMQRREA